MLSLLAAWAAVLVEATGGSTVNEGVGSLKAGGGTLVDVDVIASGTGAKGDDVGVS